MKSRRRQATTHSSLKSGIPSSNKNSQTLYCVDLNWTVVYPWNLLMRELFYCAPSICRYLAPLNNNNNNNNDDNDDDDDDDDEKIITRWW